MRPYLDLLKQVLDHGIAKGDHTGTVSIFGAQLRSSSLHNAYHRDGNVGQRCQMPLEQ